MIEELTFETNAPKIVTKAYLKRIGMTRKKYKKWRNECVVGEPQPTFKYTVEQLKEENWIGLYNEIS